MGDGSCTPPTRPQVVAYSVTRKALMESYFEVNRDRQSMAAMRLRSQQSLESRQ